MLAIEVGLLTAALRMPLWAGVLLLIVGSIIAVSFWHNEKSPKSIGGWAALFVGSLVAGALFFAIDIAIGMSSHPELSPIQAGTQAGSPFGFGLTIMVCPGLTMVSLAGIVREAFQRRVGAFGRVSSDT